VPEQSFGVLMCFTPKCSLPKVMDRSCVVVEWGDVLEWKQNPLGTRIVYVKLDCDRWCVDDGGSDGHDDYNETTSAMCLTLNFTNELVYPPKAVGLKRSKTDGVLIFFSNRVSSKYMLPSARGWWNRMNRDIYWRPVVSYQASVIPHILSQVSPAKGWAVIYLHMNPAQTKLTFSHT